MLGIWSDLVFAARVLRRSRGFTIIAASSLALAIGANTTIFPSANNFSSIGSTSLTHHR
jgi:hypothetical protein